MKKIVLASNFPVEILDEDKKHIKDVDSLYAARKYCNIRDEGAVWRYLFIKTTRKHSNRKRGILSKATGKRYHFKLKQE